MQRLLRRVGATAAALAISCGPQGYAVVLHTGDAGAASMPAAFEVYVVNACPAALGDAPVSPLQSVAFRGTTGSSDLGDIAPGTVVLYARARDATCHVVAAACASFTVSAHGSGVLALDLVAVTPSSATCDATIQCIAGLCDVTDGG